MISELSPAQLDELALFSTRPLTLPTKTSVLATDQTRLLLPEVHGDATYKNNVRQFSHQLLDELVASSPSLKGTVRRHLWGHRDALVVLMHSIAYVCSYPVHYQVVAVSLNASDYRPGRYFADLSYTYIDRLVTMLTEPEQGQALCRMRRGTFDRETGEGVRTRIEPMADLKNRLVRAGLVWSAHPHRLPMLTQQQLLFMRDRNSDERHPLSRPLSASEEVLPLVNARLLRAEIVVSFPDFQSYQKLWDYRDRRFTIAGGGQLYRQFVGDEHSGGRINGHWVQSLPKELRQHLTINGERVFEYDYQGMQVALAYEEVGEEPPSGDPYLLPGYGEEHREYFKACFTSAMGTAEKHSLMSVFSRAVQRRTGSFLNPGQAQAMAEAFWSHHEPLRELGKTEAWKRLQHAESEIILEVLRRLEGQAIPVIPMHDAAIVPLSHELELRRAMRDATMHMEVPPRVEPARWTLDAYPQLFTTCKA